MLIACHHGHLGIVQLLSSYGARRTFPFPAPYDTAEHLAAFKGHADLRDWLILSRLWTTPLHHLEVLTPERALALLRDGADLHADGADLHAAAAPGEGGVPQTPLDRAKELCMTGRAAAGSAAHVVLEWGAPWSRQTHRFYPPAVRARVVEVRVRPCALFSAQGPSRTRATGRP